MNDENKQQISVLIRRLDNRKMREAQLTKALHQIASASPCVSHPGTERERTCVLCETFINVARDALGRERWPAESVPLDTSRDVVHNVAKETQ